MKKPLLALVLVWAVVGGCSSLTSRWNPDRAVADANFDIVCGHIRFAYVGAVASYAPGIPDDSYGLLRAYERLKVGPQGCLQDGRHEERKEYARRYNQTMLAHVAKQQ